MIQERDKNILNIFAERVRQEFPEAKIWAFGSRARGDAVEESDLDICVVVKNLNKQKWEAISDIAWEVGFDNDVLISTVKFSTEAFEQGPPSESPLVRNIYQEGVPA
jgi:predicted nucleotidyltransferase